MNDRFEQLKSKYRLSTHALKLDVREAEQRLRLIIDALERRVAELEAKAK